MTLELGQKPSPVPFLGRNIAEIKDAVLLAQPFYTTTICEILRLLKQYRKRSLTALPQPNSFPKSIIWWNRWYWNSTSRKKLITFLFSGICSLFFLVRAKWAISFITRGRWWKKKMYLFFFCLLGVFLAFLVNQTTREHK